MDGVNEDGTIWRIEDSDLRHIGTLKPTPGSILACRIIVTISSFKPCCVTAPRTVQRGATAVLPRRCSVDYDDIVVVMLREI